MRSHGHGRACILGTAVRIQHGTPNKMLILMPCCISQKGLLVMTSAQLSTCQMKNHFYLLIFTLFIYLGLL